MGKIVDRKLKKHLGELIEDSGAKPKDKVKMALLADKFYKDCKPSLDSCNAPFKVRKDIMFNFLLFTVQFETICAQAFKPFSGSQSTAEDIIRIHQENQKQEIFGLDAIKLDNNLKQIN